MKLFRLSLKEEALLEKISQEAWVDEKESISHLIKILKRNGYEPAEIQKKAQTLIKGLKDSAAHGTIETFFHEYGLNSVEGLAMMRLAEALLRIPDTVTANELIHDVLKQTNWHSHAGLNKSHFINVSAIGLQLVKQLTEMDKMVHTLTDPMIRYTIKKTISKIGDEFVLGQTIDEALKHSRRYEKKGYSFSYDMLGEGARSEEQADEYFRQYLHLLETLEGKTDKGISIKLSALTPHLTWRKKELLRVTLFPRIMALIGKAKEGQIRVIFDAEESHRQDILLWVFTQIYQHEICNNYEGLGLAVQAYQKRSFKLLEYIVKLAKTRKRQIPVRLVKGAYWDFEIKYTQIEGLDSYPVYTHKNFTDVSYLACANYLLQHHRFCYGQFATHNAYSIAAIQQMALHYGLEKKDMEFQLLYGMGAGIYDQIVTQYQCRIYAPIGNHQELLPYLIRRLIENGASSSFVNQLSGKNISIEQLIADPVQTTQDVLDQQNLVKSIPLPHDLYSDRQNSLGVDMGNRAQIQSWQNALLQIQGQNYKASSYIGGKKLSLPKNHERSVFSPYDPEQLVGNVTLLKEELLTNVIGAAQEGTIIWQSYHVQERSDLLLEIANIFEAEQLVLVSLLQREAGKTFHDAISEVREAIDFCRYYAQQALCLMEGKDLPSSTGETNYLSLHPKGIFVCISPWNFPLAIFTGQIVAALVTGNVVIAKPAEVTSLIANKIIELMYQAGIPKQALYLILTGGQEVSRHILSSPAIAGVCFTGSIETARRIEHTLASRKTALASFIAETGGQNAMIIDSSALLPQTIDDIIASAFLSAGQRCSACRVIFVQEDIAPQLESLLNAAMQSLLMGDPRLLETDIGPVINAHAQQQLQAYIHTMTRQHRLIAKTPVPIHLKGYFVAPHLFGIDHLSDLQSEQFGPILHMIQFSSHQLDEVIRQINESGYGLTLGIQTRIQGRADYIAQRVHVGNIYINRPMTGAVVGVQPFGGEGLSGTGFKAGGPHYLLRFLNERVVTNNLTSIGGNLALYSEE